MTCDTLSKWSSKNLLKPHLCTFPKNMKVFYLICCLPDIDCDRQNKGTMMNDLIAG